MKDVIEKAEEFLEKAKKEAVLCAGEVEDILKLIIPSYKLARKILEVRSGQIDRQDQIIEGLCNQAPESFIKKMFSLDRVKGVTIDIDDVEPSGRLAYSAIDMETGQVLVSGTTATRAPGFEGLTKKEMLDKLSEMTQEMGGYEEIEG